MKDNHNEKTASGRREKIASILREAEEAVSASHLAGVCGVSRQVIVGDIALLRAQGLDIISTPRGYISGGGRPGGVVFKVACFHSPELTRQELYTIVDLGGTVIDVTVEHPVYGELSGQLNVSSRYDVDDFVRKVETGAASLLSGLTEGIHLHTVSCRDEATAARIREALREAGILLGEK